VRSAFQAGHVFEIDASVRGERLYHEKNTDRWWTRGELRPYRHGDLEAQGATNGAKGGLSQGEVRRLRKMRANAFKAVPAKQLKAPSTGTRVECLCCGEKFIPPRPWSKFKNKEHHNRYWKKIRTAGKR